MSVRFTLTLKSLSLRTLHFSNYPLLLMTLHHQPLHSKHHLSGPVCIHCKSLFDEPEEGLVASSSPCLDPSRYTPAVPFFIVIAMRSERENALNSLAYSEQIVLAKALRLCSGDTLETHKTTWRIIQPYLPHYLQLKMKFFMCMGTTKAQRWKNKSWFKRRISFCC